MKQLRRKEYLKSHPEDRWIVSAGEWVLLIVFAFLGVLGAEFALESNAAQTEAWFRAARFLMGIGFAIGVVYKDTTRGEPRDRFNRLIPRLGKMYVAGIAVVIVPTGAWDIVTSITKEVFR